MSQTTNLKLFKHDNPSANENQFDVESALNQNWDKIDTAYGNLNINKVDKVEGKGLSTNDFTDELKTKLEEIDDNQIHLTCEKASNIKVQDASGQNGSIDVFGISGQKTRKGINLTNYEDWERINAYGSLEQEEDKLIYNITNGGYGIRDIERTLKANTNYTACVDFEFTGDFGSQYGLRVDVNGSTTSLKTDGLVNFTTDETGKARMQFYVGFPYAGEYATLTVSNIKLYEGTYTKENIPEYEQYGASPSPEFPSLIENITGDIDITTSNKNFADPDAYNYDTTNYKDLDINLNDNEFTISTDSLRIATEFIKVPIRISKNGTYTFGLELKTNTAGATARALVYDTTNKKTIGTMIENNTTRYNKKTTTITIDNTVDKKNLSVLLYCNGTVGNAYSYSYKNIFVNEAQDTEFIKHEGQLITFPLEQNQKLMQDDYLANDGIHHVRNQIEFDGTENWQVSAKKYYLQISSKKTRYSLTKNKMLCSHFKETEGENANTKQGEFFEGYYATGNRNVFFNYDNGVGGLANWKSYLAQQKTAGTPVILEYELEAEEVEAYTEGQQEAHNQLQNAKTYKTVTNVFTDKADMILKYVADTKTYIDNEINSIKNQLNTINGLLSTTTTSAMLLDNMQSDLESEVL